MSLESIKPKTNGWNPSIQNVLKININVLT